VRQTKGIDGTRISFLISNFRLVLYVVCFLLGKSPASEFYMPTFRNTLFHLYRLVGVEYLPSYEDGTDRVFRNVSIENSDAGELRRRKHTTYNILATVLGSLVVSPKCSLLTKTGLINP